MLSNKLFNFVNDLFRVTLRLSRQFIVTLGLRTGFQPSLKWRGRFDFLVLYRRSRYPFVKRLKSDFLFMQCVSQFFVNLNSLFALAKPQL